MRRDVVLPVVIAALLLTVAFGAGLSLGWSSGAIGSLCVAASMAAALARVLLHDYTRER